KTVNQIAKSLKSRNKRINQRFFDPSKLSIPIITKANGDVKRVKRHSSLQKIDFLQRNTIHAHTLRQKAYHHALNQAGVNFLNVSIFNLPNLGEIQ
ncbi:hypothetical protein, partial [Gluconobacter kondonii]|uniref:hypothetical protein n=1 Tax=Gluconobacter kondonii TaxID=941463 RepID=UPI001B8B75DB